jgi:hypothetical protein
MLAAVPSATLEDMIDRVVPENPKKRRFMGLVANAAASLAASTVLVSCGEDIDPSNNAAGGVRPDTGGTGDQEDGTGADTDTTTSTTTSTTTGTTGSGTGTGTGTGTDTPGTATATDSDTVDTSNPDTSAGGGGMAPDVGGY